MFAFLYRFGEKGLSLSRELGADNNLVVVLLWGLGGIMFGFVYVEVFVVCRVFLGWMIFLGMVVVGAQEVPVALLPMGGGEEYLTPEVALSQQGAVEKSGVVGAVAPWSGYAAVEAMAVGGDAQGALAQLNARLVLAPDDVRAVYLKGMVLMQLGRAQEAERWFLMMRSNFPDYPQAYNALAVIYAAREDLPAAEAVLRELLLRHPEHQNARLNLVNVYLDLAALELKNALKDAPDDVMIANTLRALEGLRDSKK